jgi:hypothetical protein
MCSSQQRYPDAQKKSAAMEHPKKSQQGKGNSKIVFFFPQSDQKSVNAGQIIPVFTIVWDDN